MDEWRDPRDCSSSHTVFVDFGGKTRRSALGCDRKSGPPGFLMVESKVTNKTSQKKLCTGTTSTARLAPLNDLAMRPIKQNGVGLHRGVRAREEVCPRSTKPAAVSVEDFGIGAIALEPIRRFPALSSRSRMEGGKKGALYGHRPDHREENGVVGRTDGGRGRVGRRSCGDARPPSPSRVPVVLQRAGPVRALSIIVRPGCDRGRANTAKVHRSP